VSLKLFQEQKKKKGNSNSNSNKRCIALLEVISICWTEEYEANLSICQAMELDVGNPLKGEPASWSQSCVAML
jgi:hypothetical protein